MWRKRLLFRKLRQESFGSKGAALGGDNPIANHPTGTWAIRSIRGCSPRSTGGHFADVAVANRREVEVGEGPNWQVAPRTISENPPAGTSQKLGITARATIVAAATNPRQT